MTEHADDEPRWRFGVMPEWMVNQNPVQGAFFTEAADLPDRLVREALQNALDARRDDWDDPVTVRIALSGPDGALRPSQAAPYLRGLERHLAATSASDARESGAIREARDALSQPMDWVVIEDFGTTGLTGDISANGPYMRGNDFWGFFRSVGISPKGEDAGGSWGLGKWVFPDASRINACWGVTGRVGETLRYLMGMAVLETHGLNGAKHHPYGHYATAERSGADWLPMPADTETHEDFVLDAMGDFGLDQRLDQAGLSVVIPYPKAELTAESLIAAVVTHYFLPIVRDELLVFVDDGTGEVRIDAGTVAELARGLPEREGARDSDRKHSPDALAAVIALAQEGVALPGPDHIRLTEPPRHDASGIPPDRLDELRDRYDAGEMLAFEAPVPIARKGVRDRTEATFRLYVAPDPGAGRGLDYFVRGHIAIPDVTARGIRRYSARALTVVDGDSLLAHLLRDAEGPAHVAWRDQEDRVRENWARPRETIVTVRNAVAHILRALVDRPEVADADALSDLFPAHPQSKRSPRRGKGRGRGQGGRSPGGREPGGPPGTSRPLMAIDTAVGGFAVRSATVDGAGRPPVGSEWTLTFAYDVARGSPFAVFAQGVRAGIPDFDVVGEGLRVAARGVEWKPLGANELAFRVVDESFRIDVSGMDDRDLIVKIEPAPDGGEAEVPA